MVILPVGWRKCQQNPLKLWGKIFVLEKHPQFYGTFIILFNFWQVCPLTFECLQKKWTYQEVPHDQSAHAAITKENNTYLFTQSSAQGFIESSKPEPHLAVNQMTHGSSKNIMTAQKKQAFRVVEMKFWAQTPTKRFKFNFHFAHKMWGRRTVVLIAYFKKTYIKLGVSKPPTSTSKPFWGPGASLLCGTPKSRGRMLVHFRWETSDSETDGNFRP